MNSQKTVALVLILGIGVGLHLAFRGVASQLPALFPHVARERVTAVTLPAPPPEEPAKLPEKKIIFKRSGVEAQDHRPWVSPSLLKASSIPLLPSLEGLVADAYFPLPPALTGPVDFWKKIYGLYDTHQVVLHDSRHLDILYSVLDFHSLDDNKRLTDVEKKKIREAEVAREVKRIQETLTDEEAQERVRSQIGMKDKFWEGLQRSGRYLPIFEEIFEAYGLPGKLTRLAFVESLFKEQSFSKVGAAGLWQFMPATGKRYLTINRLIDERYDPVLATHAAARLLKKNYELLGSWPLAINAYNSGAGHLQRAVNQLGTTDIGRIIWEYDHPDYAFASRNFYPEFLAALDVSENEERYFGRVEKELPMAFDLVELPVTMTFPEIAALAGLSLADLEDLHPSFAPTVFEGKYALPAGTEIRLPPGVFNHFAGRFVEKYLGGEAPLIQPASSTALSKNEDRY